METFKAVALAITVQIALVSVVEAQAHSAGNSDLRDTSQCPSARGYSAIVYDDASCTAYVFGGVDVSDLTALIDNLSINFTTLPTCQ